MKTEGKQLEKKVSKLYMDSSGFDKLALDLYRYQYDKIDIYKKWCDALNTSPDNVHALSDIPFLPIQFFKSEIIYDQDDTPEVIYKSSGTTSEKTSQHYVASRDFYLLNSAMAFAEYYGSIEDYCFLCLLPNYLEREGSSLVDMMDYFVSQSRYDISGFYLYNHEQLYDQLKSCKEQNIPTILIGVSYALLDFIESYKLSYPDLIVMETGGMKGKREEMTKEVLHNHLKDGFDVRSIHSEYGMTELLSQAYSRGQGRYQAPATMQVHLREVQDPLASLTKINKNGVLNIIDLANVHSCAFIATDDLGRLHDDGSFSIVGRLDQSDIRGCNLMIQ